LFTHQIGGGDWVDTKLTCSQNPPTTSNRSVEKLLYLWSGFPKKRKWNPEAGDSINETNPKYLGTSIKFPLRY